MLSSPRSKPRLLRHTRPVVLLLVAAAQLLASCHKASPSSGTAASRGRLSCTFDGDTVGSALEAGAAKVLELTGEAIPGGGMLTQALSYTARTLIGKDMAQCDQITMQLQAMESYTRTQISQLNARLENAFAEQVERELTMHQANFRSKIEQLGTSLSYLRQARTPAEYDLLLASPINHLKEAENWYLALAESVKQSTDARYVAGVFGMLGFQGPYLVYLTRLHEVLTADKKAWVLPHREQLQIGIQDFRKSFAKFAAALAIRRANARTEGSIVLTSGDRYRVQFFDAAHQPLDAMVPAPVINGFGSFIPIPETYEQRRADAATAEMTFPDEAYADFTVSAFGGQVVKRTISLQGVKAVVDPNPLKDCGQSGRPACRELELVTKAGIEAIPEYRNAKAKVDGLIAAMNEKQVSKLLQVAGVFWL